MRADAEFRKLVLGTGEQLLLLQQVVEVATELGVVEHVARF